MADFYEIQCLLGDTPKTPKMLFWQKCKAALIFAKSDWTENQLERLKGGETYGTGGEPIMLFEVPSIRR